MRSLLTSLACGALAGGLVSTHAEATIIYTDLTASPVVINSTNSQHLIDFDGGGTDFYLYHSSGLSGLDGNMNADSIAQGSLGVAAVSSGTFLDYSLLLSAGTLIGSPSLTFTAGSTYMAYNQIDPIDGRTDNLGYWANGAGWDGVTPGSGTGFRGFLGIQFEGNATSQPLYAWADVAIQPYSSSDPDAFAITLYGYAYETQDNVSIIAGSTSSPVPEPASLVLLATGLGVLAARRR